MLSESDLDTFVELVRRVESEAIQLPAAHPDAILLADGDSEDLLYRSEYTRLWCSLGIACIADDLPESYYWILDTIVRELSNEDRRYLPVTYSEEWLCAIRWAIPQISPSATDSLRDNVKERLFHVGTACQRLRHRGYKIDIKTHGPHLSPETRKEITEDIDSLIAKMGGIDTVQQLCEFVGRAGKVHDGMWLLGNLTSSYGNAPDPALPVGWLLSISLRHIHRKQSTANPADTWKSITRLAIDFAASMDCQRYNKFDGHSLEATDFFPALQESLVWRELFTLPQIPPLALTTLRDSFSQIQWPGGTDVLRLDVDALFSELGVLLASLSASCLTVFPLADARSAFPLLWRHAHACPGAANAKYIDPFGAHPRDHDRFVFFETNDEQVVVLPPALAMAAGCEAIFRLVRDQARDAAGDIAGNTIEKSVSIACNKHPTPVWEKVNYQADGTDLEIDVAVRDGQEIVLFETKAKSLRSVSRTGDMMSFIEDYTKSIMALLRQLVRHEYNIKRGLTSLTSTDEKCDALAITKVAVSPLSYGPSSDHVMANSLFCSIAKARLSSVDGKAKNVQILDVFNKKVEQIIEDIVRVASYREGQVDLVSYMLDVFWFDLGQLLYVLHRGRSVLDGLTALRSLTFSTRDFWTEAAFADRQGFTKSKWNPALGCVPNI